MEMSILSWNDWKKLNYIIVLRINIIRGQFKKEFDDLSFIKCFRCK